MSDSEYEPSVDLFKEDLTEGSDLAGSLCDFIVNNSDSADGDSFHILDLETSELSDSSNFGRDSLSQTGEIDRGGCLPEFPKPDKRFKKAFEKLPKPLSKYWLVEE
ncbi:hypothetical protein V8C42DRAFT_349331 [Trichoderma barbatum]